jgi:putative tryptophan/tyrosine transport system substrate-binding protein
MRRRDFMGVLCGVALTAPCDAYSQQSGRVWRIGRVLPGTPERGAAYPQALEQGLDDLGDVQGRNIVLTLKFADPQPAKVREVITSLLPEIDLLVTWGTIGGVAAKEVAGNVPTVFISVGAPVEIGLVQSLTHPGGNMTGITFEAATETYGKRLQILKEIVPDLGRAAIMRAVGDPNVGFAMKSLERAAPELGVSLVPIDIKSTSDLEAAFMEIRNSKIEGLLAIAGALTFTVGTEIADRALAAHLPFCSAFRETVIAGGLVSLGPDLLAMARQAAAQIDKIIKGASPADIPVEQPTRYDLYINLKTARLLNLNIPPTLLARADEVIE